MIGYTFLIYQDGGNYDWVASAPGRKLILDSEFRTDSIPGEVVQWSGQGGFPECGEKACVVVPVADAQALSTVVGAIKGGKLPVQSIIVTSITMTQMNEMDKTFQGAPNSQQQWGQLLKAFAPSLKALMQSAKDQRTAIECVVITAGSKEIVAGDSVKVRPFIEGQLLSRISYLTDVIGYLTKRKVGQKKVNNLQIESSDSVYARSNYGSLDKYNGYISDPSITTLIADMKQKEN